MNRDLDWDGCVNVRDLGGLGSIRPGAVVRMEEPTRLCAAGWAAAEAYGIRTFVDLRHAEECDPDLAPRPATITTVRVPLEPLGTPFYDHWVTIDNLSSPLYYSAMLAEHPEPVIAALRAIATAAPGGVVFHCAGGKDRTGLVALVLLKLAGATPDEIVADHLLTYDRMAARYAELGVEDILGRTTRRVEQHGTTMEAALTATITSLEMPAFLRNNGMTTAEIDALRTRLGGGAEVR